MEVTQVRVFGVLCALGVILTGCGKPSDPVTVQTQAPEKRAVSAVEVRRSTLVNDLTLTAEFLPYQEVDVMAKVSGYIRKIEVDVGQRVAQGQLLATVEVPEMADDIAKFAASIERSQAELARARNEVKRTETAYEMAHLSYTRLAAVQKSRPGLVAQQEIDTARNRDLLAESQIATAKASLAAAEQSLKMQEADAGRAKTLYAYTRVTAPFDGVISKRYLDTGAMIQAGTSSHTQAMPVARISQIHTLRLVLPVPESAVPKLRVGMPVQIKVAALHRAIDGRVSRFTGRINAATRTMQAEVDVPNPQAQMAPGMFAEATLRLDERASVLALPPMAIDSEHGKRSVLVISPQGRLAKREVETGIETPEAVEIREGLQEGELVVSGGRGQLKEGQVVNAKRQQQEAK
jgi:RND family efflux transporter MFP subunit